MVGVLSLKANMGTGSNTNPGNTRTGGTTTTTETERTDNTNVGTVRTETEMGSNQNTGNTTGTINKGKAVQAMWTGSVDGNSIRGNFTWTNSNGQSFNYTFTGAKATQKDLDESQELGSR